MVWVLMGTVGSRWVRGRAQPSPNQGPVLLPWLHQERMTVPGPLWVFSYAGKVGREEGCWASWMQPPILGSRPHCVPTVCLCPPLVK